MHNGENISVLSSVLVLYRALWRYAKGHRASLVIAAILLLVSELMRLSLPWLAGSAMNVLQAEGRQGLRPAAVLLAQLFGMVALAWICHAKGRILERNVALSVRQAFALHLMQLMLRAPLHWHRKEHPVVLAQRAMQGTGALSDFAESQWIYLQGSVQIIGPLAALYLISPLVGLVAAISVSVLMVVSISFDRVQLGLTDAKNAAERHNASTWTDVLSYFLTVHALRLHHGVIAMVRLRLSEIFKPLRRLVFVNEIKWGAMELLGTLSWISVVMVYVWQISSVVNQPGSAAGNGAIALVGGIALGSVFMVYEYARKSEISMHTLAGDFAMLAGQLSGFRSVQALLLAPQTGEKTAIQASAWKELDFHQVSFQFEPIQGDAPSKLVLHEITFQLQRQNRYAVVGCSGAGKTALLNLLAGLETPSQGNVMLDGRSVSSEDLRREVTLIPNQAAVFAGSVDENIQLGGEVSCLPGVTDAAPKCPADSLQVWRALDAVGLKEFVHALPQSSDTLIGEGTARWSTGQEQRLILARGLLAAHGSSMLLLDEPTSHLDASSAQYVMNNVLRQFPTACFVVALHDLKLLKYFNRVIVMQEGRVVDMGEVQQVQRRCAVLQALIEQPESALVQPALYKAAEGSALV